MTESWSRLRTSALDSVCTLRDLLEDPDVEDRRLVAAYLESKQALAHAFAAFSGEKYGDEGALVRAKLMVETEMRVKYAYAPAKYLRVRGYGGVHTRLLAYLTRSRGSEVSVAELRMLTGDAVHTERRVRELRDLGFQLEASHTAGSDMYRLVSVEPDATLGASLQMAKNIREDRSLSASQIQELLHRFGLMP